MNPALLIPLLQAFMSLAGKVPELLTAGETAVNLIRSGKDPSPEQQVQFDLALEAANKALQES